MPTLTLTTFVLLLSFLSARTRPNRTEFIAALQAAGIEAVLIDAPSLTHNEVDSEIGAPGDMVMTAPLLSFFIGVF